MLKKLLSIVLMLALLSCAALAEEVYAAETPLSGADDAQLSNLARAVYALDGLSVAYGDSFSFNAALGPRDEENGYIEAPDGRGESVVGGGVAQAATTLYLALLKVPGRLSFGPVEVYGDAFTGDYVESGALAVRADDAEGCDLSFTNYADDMTLSLRLDGEMLRCAVSLGATADAGGWFDSWSVPAAPADTKRPGSRRIAAASLDCGEDANVLHNVGLAADCVYDTTLAADDVFSFNETVGPRTSKFGFKPAVNGRGVEVTGGGVAQVASAVWLAVKDLDEVSIVEKSTYGKRYSQHYVANSSDAILIDYNEGRDFSFAYNGSGAITIYTWVEDHTLYCEIYSNGN